MESIVTNRINPYLQLMRLHKPIGTLLLLWPTLWALWLAAKGIPNISILIRFMVGVVIMRSAGCVINDIADKDFDGHVARTKSRPLVTGVVSIKAAWCLFALLCICGFILIMQLNVLTIKLSYIALLLACIYPFMKRITYFPQVVLGAAFAWAVPMAFAAQTNEVPLIAWVLYFLAWLWPIAYDSVYALMDKEDDMKVGIKSTVIFFGRHDLLIIFSIYIFMLLGLLWLGWWLTMGIYYFQSIILAGLLIGYQYYLVRIVKDYQRAFISNHWVGFVVFLGIALHYFN